MKSALRIAALVLVLPGIAIVVAAYAARSPGPQIPPPVQVESGLRQGFWEGDVTVYRGIPYAAPPVGDAAAHGAELAYVFGFVPAPAFYTMEPPWEAYRDAALAEQMQRYWTNFAKTGNPNERGLPLWPRFTPRSRTMLELGNSTEARPLRRTREHELMSAYYESLYRR